MLATIKLPISPRQVGTTNLTDSASDSNQITDITCWRHSPTLRWLRLGDNQITYFNLLIELDRSTDALYYAN